MNRQYQDEGYGDVEEDYVESKIEQDFENDNPLTSIFDDIQKSFDELDENMRNFF